MRPREVAQFGEFAFGDGFGALDQIAQEIDHAIRFAGHLRRQRFLGGIGEAEQRGRFVAQRQDLRHARGVVELARVRTLVRRTRLIRAIDAFANRAIVSVSKHGRHTWLFQRELESVAVAEHAEFAFRNSSKRCFVDGFAPRIGRIEHGVFEFGGQARQLVEDLAKTRARRFFQAHAGQPEIAQRVIDQRARRQRQRAEIRALGRNFHGGEQLAVLSHLRRIFAEQLLGLGVRGAQCFAIGH